MMQHVFISYDRADSGLMDGIRDALKEQGLKTWTSEYLTPGSTSWSFATPRAIRDASVVLCLWDENAHESEWVKLELYYARKYHSEVMVALVGAGHEASLTESLAEAPRFDLRDDTFDDEFTRLVSVLYERLGTGAAASSG